MTWHYLDENSIPSSYSPELEEVSSGLNSSAIAPSVLLSLIPTRDGFSSRDSKIGCSQDSRSGMTSPHSTGGHGEAEHIASPADFPAPISPQQTQKEPGFKAPAPVSGGRWRELSVKYDPNTSSWKTHRCLFVVALPWSSVTLPRSGMMLGGVCWELITSEHPTSGTASGSWLPTPTATPYGSNRGGGHGRTGKIRYSLSSMARHNLWPTPTTNGLDGGSGHRRHPNFQPAGTLHPAFLEWLMGWPIGWTGIEPLAMDKFPTAMQLHGGCWVGHE